MIYVIAYVVLAVVVGTLCSNVFLNKAYEKELPTYYNPRNKETPGYISEAKKSAYRRAVIDSQIDRNFSFILGGLCWPIALFILAGYYARPWWTKIPRVSLGISTASRDVKKAEALAIAEHEQKAIEAKNKEEWNAMVDLLNENEINHLNYQKK